MNLEQQYISYDNTHRYVLENILDMRGTVGNDVIYHSNEANIIAAGNGDDEISLTDGEDLVKTLT